MDEFSIMYILGTSIFVILPAWRDHSASTITALRGR